MIRFDLNLTSTQTRMRMSCDDPTIFDNIRDHFSVANEGASFAPRHRRKYIPRRKYVITGTGLCDIGMYWLIKQYLIANQIKVDVVVSDKLREYLVTGIDTTFAGDYNFDARDYQIESINRALKMGCGTLVLGTGAGKTFITAALIENYFRYHRSSDAFKCIIIVPNIGLVSQTYNAFEKVGVTFTYSKWTGSHDLDSSTNVVICNTSILQNRFTDNKWLEFVDLLIVDECHGIKKNNTITKYISKIKCKNRYGLTGTLPEEDIDLWNIIGKFGPVIYEKSSHELRKEGYLTEVVVSIIKISYPGSYFEKYQDELSFIYSSDKRNQIIYKLVQKLKNNTLILVNHINHGEILHELLMSISDKHVYFIRGDVEIEDREVIQQQMEDSHDVVCIAISKIFSTGIDIPNIHNIVFAAGGKAFTRTVQSIGRGLRKHITKSRLTIFDLYDNLKYGNRHCEERKRIYSKECIKYVEKSI